MGVSCNPSAHASLSQPLLDAFLEDGLIGVPHCVYDIGDRVHGDVSSFVQRTETEAVILVHLQGKGGIIYKRTTAADRPNGLLTQGPGRNSVSASEEGFHSLAASGDLTNKSE